MQMYVEENAQFQLKVVEKSGLNRDGTYLPPAIHPTYAKEPKYDMKTAMVEAEMVMGGVVADLLEKTGGSVRSLPNWKSDASVYAAASFDRDCTAINSMFVLPCRNQG